MSAPRVLWAHFMLRHLCFGCAVGELPTASPLSLRVGNDTNRVPVRCAQWMMRTIFS